MTMLQSLMRRIGYHRVDEPRVVVEVCDHEAGTSGVRIIAEGVYERRCGKCGLYYGVE